MKYDPNQLERAAARLVSQERYCDALKIYLFVSSGDPSLDAGYLGARIAQCYVGIKHLRQDQTSACG